jgi:hypothetical protein
MTPEERKEKMKILIPYQPKIECPLGRPACLYCQKEFVAVQRDGVDLWERDCFCMERPRMGDLYQMEQRILAAIKESKK